jgi:hypothetical protein
MNQAILFSVQTVPSHQATHPGAGNPVSELRPNAGRLAVGLGLGVLAAAAGVGILVGTFRADGHLAWYFLGLALLLAGGAVVLVVSHLATLRILVSPNGYAIATLGRGEGRRCFRIDAETIPAGWLAADRSASPRPPTEYVEAVAG